jgi:ABC-type Fe3+ transport system substrate-binding protein
VAHTKTEASKAEALKGFVKYATGEGQELCSKKHYAKLPKNLVEKVVASLEKMGK